MVRFNDKHWTRPFSINAVSSHSLDSCVDGKSRSLIGEMYCVFGDGVFNFDLNSFSIQVQPVASAVLVYAGKPVIDHTVADGSRCHDTWIKGYRYIKHVSYAAGVEKDAFNCSWKHLNVVIISVY